MHSENATSKFGKIVRVCLLVAAFMLLFAISALAATPYEVTKSGGSHVRKTYYEDGQSVRKAPQGSIVWVTGEKINLKLRKWYQLTDGNWIYSGNVTKHSCSWTYTGRTAPTCTSTGKNHYRCNKCGTTDWDSIAALGHNYSGHVCTRCGVWDTASLKSRKSVSSVKYYVTTNGAKVHSGPYGACATIATLNRGNEIIVTEELVNASGNTWYRYSGGYIFKDYVIQHNSCLWTTVSTNRQPTCTSTGVKTQLCGICARSRTASIPALGHSYSGHVCTRCNAWDTASLKSQKSVSNVKYCVKTNGAKVHSGPYGACKTVATLNKGTDIYVTQVVVNASGNTWYRYSGGYIFEDYVRKHDSCSWTLGTITKAPTCTSAGTKQQTCTICLKTRNVTVDKLGHSYKDHVCKTCGAWKTSSLKSKASVNSVEYCVIKAGAKVHSGPYGDCKTTKTLNKGTKIVVTEKLVNAFGKTWYKYSDGYIYKDYVKEHKYCSWDSGKVTKAATCKATGSKVKTCTLCGKTKTSTIAKTGHQYKDHVCKTCSAWKASELKSESKIKNVKYYVVKAGAKVHSGPYGDCRTVTTLSKGTEIVVTEKMVNAFGKTWYRYNGGYIFGDYVKAHNTCSWNSGKVTKAATCKATGSKVQTCTVCQKTKTVTIAKTGHSYKSNVCKTCGTWNTSSLKSKKSVNNLKYYAVKDSVKVRTGPYEGCKAVKTLYYGYNIVVTQEVVNASGNTWYKCSDGYIFSGNVKAYSKKNASVTLNADSKTLYVGQTAQLKAVIKGPSSKTTWKSSNSSVASVNSSGKITVKKAGSCTITATANGKKDTCKITVKQLAAPQSAKLSTVKSGRQFKISHKAVSGASGYEITYQDAFGAKKTKTYTGTSATITVSAANSCSYKCTVRAYKVIDGKKYYGKATSTYSVHVHNAPKDTVKKTYTKYSKTDYTYHSAKSQPSFTCVGCDKKITCRTTTAKEKHSFVAAVCQHCGEKKGANYVIGKIYPEVGDGPSYSSSEKNKSGQNPIYMAAKYADGYFLQDSTKFNEDLCKLSAIGASASYNKGFAKEFLVECGISSKVIQNITKKSTSAKGDNDHARMTIGYKKLTGTNKVLVAVLINGYNTGAYEWISNFNVGKKDGALHEGFSKAAMELAQDINKYISDNGLNTSNVKIWITGHSRGGAVAGMTAVEMNKKYGIGDVYAYGFATPNGVPTDLAKKTKSNNIFNIVNPGDFVPYVVPTKWDFTKYGQNTITISMNSTAKSAYKAMSGDTYDGLGQIGRGILITAFSAYSSDREAYYKVKNGASPSDLGRGLGLFLSDGDKNEAYEILIKCATSVNVKMDDLDDLSLEDLESFDLNKQAVLVLALMYYDGSFTTKIHEAHTMETYVAMLYSKYP